MSRLVGSFELADQVAMEFTINSDSIFGDRFYIEHIMHGMKHTLPVKADAFFSILEDMYADSLQPTNVMGLISYEDGCGVMTKCSDLLQDIELIKKYCPSGAEFIKEF